MTTGTFRCLTCRSPTIWMFALACMGTPACGVGFEEAREHQTADPPTPTPPVAPAPNESPAANPTSIVKSAQSEPPKPVECPSADDVLKKATASFGDSDSEGETTVTDAGDLNGDGLNEFEATYVDRAVQVFWIASRTQTSCYRLVVKEGSGSVGKALSSRTNGWRDLSIGLSLNSAGGMSMVCQVTLRAAYDGNRYVVREVLSAAPAVEGGNFTAVDCQRQAASFVEK
jgi:hypothetical protein